MRVCPKCGYRDPPIWRPAKMHNPSGDIDIARIEDVEVWQEQIGEQLKMKRGKEAVVEGIFAYYIGKRGVWVRRIAADLFKVAGLSAFNPPYEMSHSPLAKRVFGRKRLS